MGHAKISFFCRKNLKHFASRSHKTVDDHDLARKGTAFFDKFFFSFFFLLISATTYKAINYIQR